MLRIFLIVTFILLATSNTVLAGDDDALWLARCMVNEAGFWAVNDHLALAAVLKKQARRLRVSTADIVQMYCGGLRPNKKHNRRHRWILELNIRGTEPKHWIANDGKWKWYRDQWYTLLILADLALHPKAHDPCGGRAAHWGGKMDTPDKSLIRIDCGPTRNIFYAYRNR
jgi:hypothetical protein